MKPHHKLSDSTPHSTKSKSAAAAAYFHEPAHKGLLLYLLQVTFLTFLTAASLSETTMATLPCSGHPMSTSAEGLPRLSCNPFAASCTHQNIHRHQKVHAPDMGCSLSLAEDDFLCSALAR